MKHIFIFINYIYSAYLYIDRGLALINYFECYDDIHDFYILVKNIIAMILVETIQLIQVSKINRFTIISN